MGRARAPDSAQQSVCLSCHDEHLSCPQSVWEEFLFPLLRRAGEGGKRIEGWGNRRWDALKEKDGGRGRSVCCLLTG